MPDASAGFHIGGWFFLMIVALADPLNAVLSVIGGWFARRWQVLLVPPIAVTLRLLLQFLLPMGQHEPRYGSAIFAVLPLLVAGFVWSAIASRARREMRGP